MKKSREGFSEECTEDISEEALRDFSEAVSEGVSGRLVATIEEVREQEAAENRSTSEDGAENRSISLDAFLKLEHRHMVLKSMHSALARGITEEREGLIAADRYDNKWVDEAIDEAIELDRKTKNVPALIELIEDADIPSALAKRLVQHMEGFIND